MKKIPTLFKRTFDVQHHKGIVNEVTPGMEWVLDGEGIATVKFDGTCCAIIGGRFFRRYDAKKGKTPPEGAIPCCDPDPVTGHWPHWHPCNPVNAADNWHLAAYFNSGGVHLHDGTYEAIGPHFQSNPYSLEHDILVQHGREIVKDVVRSFNGIRDYFRDHEIEGLVFWRDGEPQCKIKRADFGFPWPPVKADETEMGNAEQEWIREQM